MRNKFNNSQNQLRQVVLLLAIAVILPAGCLIWFMTQAVKNERLAFRQRIINIYKAEFENVLTKAENEYSKYIDKLRPVLTIKDTQKIFYLDNSQYEIEGLLIFDANEQLLYPTTRNENESTDELQMEFIKAAQLESAGDKPAIEVYESIISKTQSAAVIKKAQLAKARILRKAGEYDKTLELCKEICQPAGTNNSQTGYMRACGWIIYCELLNELSKTDVNYAIQFETAFNEFSYYLLNSASTENPLNLTSDQRAVLASKLLEIDGEKFDFRQIFESPSDADSNTDSKALTNSLQTNLSTNYSASRVMQLARAENCSLQMADRYKWSDFAKLDEETIYQLPNNIYYCSVLNVKGLHYVIFRTSRFPLQIELNLYALPFIRIGGKIVSEDFIVRFSDLPKQIKPQGEMLFEIPVSRYFPGRKVELYPKKDNFLIEFANKKRIVYIWVAGAVVLLMLASTFLAGSAVLKQAKLNKLKNDFIATITHELKTPLASMRILVDTLLDEKCQSRQQEIEYLQLISKENVRLSRLIDNFLTFSRMERNKQAFDFAPANPAEIAQAAAEAVQTKFNNHNCKFTVTLDENLPPILADKDAMITVLVNLLDNAYKYSGENKEISFNVSAAGESVCFAVKDNGIGLTRRQIKKVFDKFYQVDSSLSRKVEGTGLGLSIVKFIVDAHKGKIDVESKLGKGSEFKVKISHE